LTRTKGAASQVLFVRASNKHLFSRFTSPSHRVWHSLLHHKGVSNREACRVPFLSISPSLPVNNNLVLTTIMEPTLTHMLYPRQVGTNTSFNGPNR
jgi:hypothetical protein